MEISSFDDLLSAARQQEQPQRLLFVFTEAELDPDSTEAQRRDFEAGHGGALVPVLTADKSPDELAGFATMVQESQLIGKSWAVVFVAALSGFIPFDREGHTVVFE